MLATASAVLAAFSDLDALTFAQLVTALGAATGLALYLIVSERRRHELVEEDLSAQASFLESLVESMGAVAATLDADRVLEQARREAERLFDARATMLTPGQLAGRSDGKVMVVPLRARDQEIAVLRLERERPFKRGDFVRATVLADIAARTSENARLRAEAETREAERARLSDQLISAEQDERRRLADELHDGAVQSLSGIALMLDAAVDSIEQERHGDAANVLRGALVRHRDTIRSLRDLSFNLEPVVLRDQGFAPAVKALAEGIGLAHEMQIDVDVDAGEALTPQARAVLYQIVREAIVQAVRRGPPTRIGVRVVGTDDGGFETVVWDDAPGERRRASFDVIAERARTLSGSLTVEQGADGGTTVRVALPAYAAGEAGARDGGSPAA
ncbi:MAG: histidine kinase [Actinomycetota bacterium]|nr:histidine kinase [Actinomycetota bacterium]